MDEEEVLLPPPPKRGVEASAPTEELLLPPPPKKEANVFGNNPMVPDFIENSSLAKTIVSGLEDTLPQQFLGGQQRTASEKSHAANATSDPEQYVRQNLVDFQKYIREKKGLKWYQPFDENDWMQESQSFLKDQRQLNEKAAKIEGKIQEQKDQAQEHLKGVVTDLRDINSATDAMSWASHMVGQGLYQIPTSIASGGSSSFFMEAAIIYDAQLDALAKEHGISREEVVRRGLDDPAKGAAYTGIAGALDATSAGELFNIFRKAATKSLTKQAVNNFFKEGITEGIQGNLERLASNDKFDPLTHDNMMETLNETLGGGLGGTALGSMSGESPVEEMQSRKAVDPQAEIRQAEVIVGRDPATKSGDQEIDDTIDSDYASIAQQLDAIVEDEEKVPTLADVANDVDKYASEVADDIDAFNQDALAEEQQVPISDENEIVDPNATFTPQEAGALQASQLPGQSEQELNLDDSEQTPAIPTTPQEPTVAPEIAPTPPVESTPPSIRQDTEIQAKENAVKKQEKAALRLQSLEEKRAETERRNVERVHKEIENTDKLKPGARARRLQLLNEETLDNPELNQKVQEKLKTLEAIRNEKEFSKRMKTATPEEKLSIISQRVGHEEAAFETLRTATEGLKSNDLNEVQKAYDTFTEASDRIEKSPFLLSVEQAEVKGFANNVKQQFEKKLEPKRKAEEEANKAAKAQGRATTAEKDSHLTAVAKAQVQGLSGQVDLAVQSYQKWRADHGLSPLSKEDITKKAGAEFYQERAKKQVKTGETPSESAARKAAKEDIRKQFGLSEDSDINLMGNFHELDPELEGLTNNFSNLRESSVDELIDRIKSFYLGNDRFFNSIKALIETANKISKKFTKNGLEVYIGDQYKGVAGFHGFDHDAGRELLVVASDATGSTDAHEFIHFIVRAAINQLSTISKASKENSALAVAYKQFYTEASKIFKNAREEYRNELVHMQRAVASGEELTPRQQQLMLYIQGYLQTRGKNDFVQGPLTSAQLVDLLANTYPEGMYETSYRAGMLSYLFYDADEMLAETFSNPFAMGIMAMMESPTKTTEGKSQSYFRQLINGLKDFLSKILDSTGIKLTPVKNSYLSELTEFMEKMEQSFLNPETLGTPVPPVEGLFANAKRTFFNLMAVDKVTSPAVRKIASKLANAWWRDSSLKTVADVQAKIDKINAATKGNTKFKPDDVNYIWSKIEGYRQELKDAKTIQTNVKNHAKTLPQYKESLSFKKDVDDFIAVDLDALSTKKVRAWGKGMIDLVMGGTPSYESYNIVNKDQAQKALAKLLPTSGKYANDPGVFFAPGVKISLKHLANPATFATILSKYNTPVAKELFATIYGGMLESRTIAQKESNSFISSMYETVTKQNLSHSDFARAQIFANAFTTNLTEEQEGYWEEVEQNLNQIVENTLNKIRANNSGVYNGDKGRIAKENQIAQELKETILKKKSMKGILSKGQQELYDKFRAFNDKHKSDIARTQGVWGDDEFIPLNNYVPSMALGKVKDGNIGGENPLITNPQGDNLYDAVTGNKNYGRISGKQSGNRKEKQAPKGYFYDYDMMSIAHKYSTSMLLDVYSTRELKKLNLLLNGANGTPVQVEGKNIHNVMSPKAITGLNYQLRSIAGAAAASDPEVGKALAGLFKAKDYMTKAVLATTGQFLVQASSAFPAAIIMSPKGYYRASKVLAGFENGTKDLSTVKQFLEDNGLSIQLRDVLFERFQTVEDVQKSGVNRTGANVRAFSDKVTTYALRTGDKFAARLVWFSAFFAAGGTLENPTKDAVLEAERSVGLLQNMSDVNFSAPIFRSNSAALRVLVHMMFSFKSFAMNSGINTYYSGKYFFKSGEARQVFAANVAMSAAYHLVAVLAIRPLYKLLADAILGQGDDDDEDKNYSNTEDVAYNALWDLAVGQLSPNFMDAIARFTLGEVQKANATSKGDTYNSKSDSPIFIPPSFNDALLEAGGQYGALAEKGYHIGDALGTAVYQEMGLLESDEDKMEEKYLRSAESLMLLMEIVPFRGDALKVFKEYEKRVKSEHGAKGGSGSGEDGTEFEVPEYDLNGVDNPGEIPEYE
jgi:hypothetical protein